MSLRSEDRVAVVGGGPAGATAAHRLAARGLRVTLFEAREDGEKPCGGGIPTRAVEEFPELADPALPRRIVRSIRIHAPSGRTARVDLPAGIHMFTRRVLDARLRRCAAEAGAEIVARRVRAVRPDGPRWRVVTDDGEAGSFDVVIGADGVRSVVRRAAGPPWTERELTIALYAYVPATGRDDMILKFFGDFDGYLWVFPRTDHVSIGICARHRTVDPQRLRDEMFRFVEHHYPEGRFDDRQVKGYFIPSAVRPPVSRRGPGWALVGDAAGLTDPITREGIAHAMRSAAHLAHDLAGGRPARTPRVPHDLLRAHRIGRAFFRHAFLESLARLASGSAAIRDILADLFEGRQTYAGLKARLLLNMLPCAREVGLREVVRVARWRGPKRPGAGLPAG